MAKTFDFNHCYFIDKPVHKRTAAYDKWWFFELKERNGNELTFRHRKKFDLKDYKGKVLTNPKTGDEICFITIGMDKYMLDAKSFIGRGRRLSELSKEEKLELLGTKVEGEWNDEKQQFAKTADCGTTVGEFINKKSMSTTIN